MSDWDDVEPQVNVRSSTFVPTRSTGEESEDMNCPTCSSSGSCKCPPVLSGTGHNSSTGGGGERPARRPKSNVCHGCREEGHFIRDCPNSREDTIKARREASKVQSEYTPKEEDLDNLFETKLGTGTNFQNYEKVKVEVTPPENAPQPLDTFKKAPFSPDLLRNIQRCGYEKPTPVQKHAIPIVIMGSDLMSCAQTGSGKTAAFLLPIVHALLQKPSDPSDSSTAEVATPRALIVGPTRELVVQIVNEARKFCSRLGIRCKSIYGGTSVSGCQSFLLKGPPDILSATPGRLLDMVDREVISFKNLEFVVLDEADRMLEMGFRSAIDDIFKHFSMPDMRKRQTLLFSATFPADIQVMAAEYMRDYFFLKVGIVGGACEDIEQTIHRVRDHEKMDKLLSILNEHHAEKESKVLVFARRKKGVDFLASRLCMENFPATCIHGDRQQPQREEALADFKRGTNPILVATEVAARGLDIPKVSMVVNYDMPGDISTYVHRIGRSGRVGNKGKAVSFYDGDNDRFLAKELVEVLKTANQVVPDWLEKQGDSYYGSSRGSRGSNFNNDIRKKKRGGGASGGGPSASSPDKAELFKPAEEEDFWE